VPRAAVLILVLSAAILPACSRAFWGGSGSSSLLVHNQATDRTFQPGATTSVYLATATGDENSADVYLTDLPADRLADPADKLAGLAGSFVHIHLFLVPSAGSTPIEPSACNIAVRALLLTSPDCPDASPGSKLPLVGLYTGGGFLLPSGTPGDSSLSGSILDASLRLSAVSAPVCGVVFADPLSPAQLTGAFSATLDERRAADLAARFQQLAQSARNAPTSPTANVQAGAAPR
jgi:hypothetical protein